MSLHTCWDECYQKARENWCSYCWKCRLAQPLWKTVERFLKKLKIELPYDPEIPLLGMYPKEMKTGYRRGICLRMFIAASFTITRVWKTGYRRGICLPMFIAASFTITRVWRQCKCPSVSGWIQKMCVCVIVVVQLLSPVRLFVTPWTAARQASLSLTISWSLPKFMSIALEMPSNHLILWRPLLVLPSIFPSIRDFSNESAIHIRWPKYWSFSFSIRPSNKYSVLISLKIGWFDLLDVQGTFMNILQHHSLKASLIWHSAFFKVQLSQPYVTTGKTIALTIRTFVGRVMSLLSTPCLGWSQLSCPEAIVFWIHGCSHHQQWSQSPRRGNLSLLPPFPLLFAMK